MTRCSLVEIAIEVYPHPRQILHLVEVKIWLAYELVSEGIDCLRSCRDVKVAAVACPLAAADLVGNL